MNLSKGEQSFLLKPYHDNMVICYGQKGEILFF